MPQPRRLYINQYGSNLDPRTMEQGDFMDIELSNSISDLVYETSNSASRAHSKSSPSEASAEVRNELSSSSALHKIEVNLMIFLVSFKERWRK